MAEKFGWGITEMNRTDPEELFPFLWRYIHTHIEQKKTNAVACDDPRSPLF